MSLKHSNITEKIIKAALIVYKALGCGFLEKLYSRALFIALSNQGLIIEKEKPYNVFFQNKLIGDFYADMVVEDKVIIEIKAVSCIRKDHYKQVINYLKASGLDVGMIFNFGSPSMEFKRLVHPDILTMK